MENKALIGSQKVIETKQKFKDAFFTLYTHKKIEKISIKEITDLAGYNRATFYAHYTDIYNLVESIEDEFLAEFESKLGVIIGELFNSNPAAIALFPFEFFDKNKKYLKVLLGANGDGSFVRKIKSKLRGIFLERVKGFNLLQDKRLNYVFEYIASAQIGLLTYWMEHDEEMTIEELADMILKIMNYGPIVYMKS